MPWYPAARWDAPLLLLLGYWTHTQLIGHVFVSYTLLGRSSTIATKWSWQHIVHAGWWQITSSPDCPTSGHDGEHFPWTWLSLIVLKMLAPVVTGLPGLTSTPGPSATSMAPPSSSKAPIFGQSAKINIDAASLLPSKQTTASSSIAGPGSVSPLVTNSIQSNSFAALAQVPGSGNSGGEQKNTVQPSGNSGNESLEVTAVSPGNAKSPTKQGQGDKTTDIDALKKKLALMERETTRLRYVY